MDINIGYPEAWQEYIDHLDIHSPQEGGCLINNVLTLFNQTAQWNRARIGTPVRKDLWEDMTPQTINAAYLLTDNSINFPAGILQPPFYNSKATRYTNLGGVGTIIAHEITHSFDNDGAQFDELGRHRNWWQPSDYEEFKKRQEKIVEYYDRYLLPDGTRLNGTQTLSENIADLGGLTCITDIIGHNPEGLRQAYQNFGTIWRDKSSDSLLKAMLENIHALPHARVDGVLSSTEGFYYAYPLKPGDPMYVAPEDRAKLW
jgi:putative endopeptidase